MMKYSLLYNILEKFENFKKSTYLHRDSC